MATTDRCTDPALEALRASNPAARSLPLLAMLAQRRTGSVVVDYLSPPQLLVQRGMSGVSGSTLESRGRSRRAFRTPVP